MKRTLMIYIERKASGYELHHYCVSISACTHGHGFLRGCVFVCVTVQMPDAMLRSASQSQHVREVLGCLFPPSLCLISQLIKLQGQTAEQARGSCAALLAKLKKSL